MVYSNTFYSSYHPVQAPAACVCLVYLMVAELKVLSASMYFHIVSLVQFYTLASKRIHRKSMKSLKIAAFSNLRAEPHITTTLTVKCNFTLFTILATPTQISI